MQLILSKMLPKSLVEAPTFALASAFLLISARSSNGQMTPSAIETKATIKVMDYRYDNNTGKPDRTNVSEFWARCIVSSNRWYIETDYAKNSIRYLYFDGTNNYSTFEYTKDDDFSESFRSRGLKTPMLGIVNGRTPGMPSFVTIIPSAHPQDDAGYDIPWTAFCSAPYLNQSDRLIPIIGHGQIRHQMFAFGYEDKTVRFSDSLALPQSIELYTSKSLMEQSPQRKLLIRGKQMTPVRSALMTPVPEPDHVLQSRYQVLASTNLGGWNIPLKFSLTAMPHHENGLLVGFEAQGTVENISMVASVPQFRFKPGTNIVSDLRVRDADHMLDAVAYTVVMPGSADDARLEVPKQNSTEGSNIIAAAEAHPAEPETATSNPRPTVPKTETSAPVLDTAAVIPAVDDARVVAAFHKSLAKVSIDPSRSIRRRTIFLYLLLGCVATIPILIFLKSRVIRKPTT